MGLGYGTNVESFCKMHRYQKGLWGERLCQKHLFHRGFVFLQRGFRVAGVEWDHLYWHQNRCYVVEVRTRFSRGYADLDTLLPYTKRLRLNRSLLFAEEMIGRTYPSLYFEKVGALAVEINRAGRAVRVRVHEMVDGSW